MGTSWSQRHFPPNRKFVLKTLETSSISNTSTDTLDTLTVGKRMQGSNPRDTFEYVDKDRG